MKDLLGDTTSKEDDNDNYDLLDEPSSGKNYFFIGFAVIILAALGFIFYQFVLQGDSAPKQNPTLQANVPLLLPDAPLKEIPADAGGLEIPNQDQQVFEVIENPEPPETAVVEEEAATEETPEATEEATEKTTAAEATEETTEEPQAPETETNEAAEDVANTNLLPLPEEPQLEPEAVEGEATPEAEATPTPEATPTAEATAPETADEADSKLRIEFLETEAEEPKPIAGSGLQITIPDEPIAETTPAPEPTPAPEAEAEETTEATTEAATEATEAEAEPAKISSGDYIVQLAALDNLQSAELSRNSFIEQFPDLLLADRLVVQEGILSDGAAIFRVQMKALDIADARTLCAAIKAQGRDCFIKRAP